ncbi:MAG: DUF1304 domain-containing protein [Gammaproteobacteria bacterium]|nr:DUF1304 domain-containing protein [Gammaproteobacteria bacterium]
MQVVITIYSKEQAETSKPLAVKRGLYNGFISVGLIWGLIHPDSVFGAQIILFFLTCVITTGILLALPPKDPFYTFRSCPPPWLFYYSHP